MGNIKTLDMEIAVANFFNFRRNLIVPNVSWGLGLHECDLLILTPAGYAWEVEIKVSKQDLKKDLLKRHGHNHKKIKYLYFAIPKELEDCMGYIPKRAGIILVERRSLYLRGPFALRCKKIRSPKQNSDYKWSEQERYKLACLGNMRVWRIKQSMVSAKKGE